MSLMKRIRVYHAALAILTVLAFLSGDFGLVHDWLGYGVAAVIGFRLVWALFNPRQLGLSKFYPDFDGLRFDNAFRHPAVSKALIFGVAVSLLGATVTGVAMDGGAAVGLEGVLAEISPAGPAFANGHESGDEDGALEDLHEFLSNVTILFVVLHAGYLLLFKRPLARFMLYRDGRK